MATLLQPLQRVLRVRETTVPHLPDRHHGVNSGRRLPARAGMLPDGDRKDLLWPLLRHRDRGANGVRQCGVELPELGRQRLLRPELHRADLRERTAHRDVLPKGNDLLRRRHREAVLRRGRFRQLPWKRLSGVLLVSPGGDKRLPARRRCRTACRRLAPAALSSSMGPQPDREGCDCNRSRRKPMRPANSSRPKAPRRPCCSQRSGVGIMHRTSRGDARPSRSRRSA